MAISTRYLFMLVTMLQDLLAEETSVEGFFPNLVRTLRVHRVVGRWNSLHMMGRKWSQVASESDFLLSCLLFHPDLHSWDGSIHFEWWPSFSPSGNFPWVWLINSQFFTLMDKILLHKHNSLYWPLVSTVFLKLRSSIFTLPGPTKWYAILVSKECKIYSTDTGKEVMGYPPLFTKYTWYICVYE